jgi:heme A synthase
VHRLAGLLLAFGLALFGLWAAWRQGRRVGAVVALLGVALLLLGALAATLGGAAPPWLVVLHNAAGALALALLVREA